MRKFLMLSFCFVLVSLLLTSCKRDSVDDTTNEFKKVADYDNSVVHAWNELFLVMDRYAEGFRPVGTSMALGYIGLANYEATVTGMPEYKSLSPLYGELNIPKAFTNQEYHWPTVVNSVNNYLFSRFFPKVNQIHFSKVKSLNDRFEKEFQSEVSQEVYVRSKNHGVAVAAAVWDWYRTDAIGFELYNDPFKGNTWQERVNEPGAWVPTFPGPGDGLYPLGGKCRTFAIGEDLKLCKPYSDYVGKYTEEPGKGIYLHALEVMDQQTAEKTYVSKWVGEFWSDDLLDVTFSPPSRWLAIANQVFAKEKSSLEIAVLTSAKLGLAINDSGVGAWNSKYHYNLMRPETYIQRNIDPTFEPILYNPITNEAGISPPFPAHPSGHSTFGGAAAEILSSIFGYSYSLTDRCHENRGDFLGTPRTFNSFHQMANENGWSRVLLGVHFRVDCEEGVSYGAKIGKAVNTLPWKK